MEIKRLKTAKKKIKSNLNISRKKKLIWFPKDYNQLDPSYGKLIRALSKT